MFFLKILGKFLASLKLAVFLILSIALMAAWGTVVESYYSDSYRAQELVYRSVYSYTLFFLLVTSLVAVIVDRYPWKKKHVGFISAHVGIIILILGFVVTGFWGVDGSMAFERGATKNHITASDRDIVVYSGMSSGGVRKIYEEETHYLKFPPTASHPHRIPLGGGGELVIDGFRPYTWPTSKVVVSSSSMDRPALRFQISNDQFSESQWLVLGRQSQKSEILGKAQLVLAPKGTYSYSGGPVLLLEYEEGKQDLRYHVWKSAIPKKKTKKDRTPYHGIRRVQRGRIGPGEKIDTGWMGLTFRLLKYLPKARRVWDYEPVGRSAPSVVPALRLNFQGKTHWVGLNSSLRLFDRDAYYIFVYGNRLIPLDFSIQLDDFRVSHYQGSGRASGYESDVHIIHKGVALPQSTISMNNPLDYEGFRFYQSSFEKDPTGKPILSVLSVNRDPGRFWKYLGSLFIVLGIAHLFYLKKKKR